MLFLPKMSSQILKFVLIVKILVLINFPFLFKTTSFLTYTVIIWILNNLFLIMTIPKTQTQNNEYHSNSNHNPQTYPILITTLILFIFMLKLLIFNFEGILMRSELLLLLLINFHDVIVFVNIKCNIIIFCDFLIYKVRGMEA